MSGIPGSDKQHRTFRLWMWMGTARGGSDNSKISMKDCIEVIHIVSIHQTKFTSDKSDLEKQTQRLQCCLTLNTLLCPSLNIFSLFM